MKAIGYLFIIMFLVTCYLYGEDDEDRIIIEIREKYADINYNLTNYKKVTEEIQDASTEGGTIDIYYKDKVAEKMVVSYFGEMGMFRAEYYLDKGQLMFIFAETHRYNRPMYYDEKMARENNDTEWFDQAKTIVLENRYYFHRGKMIRWLDENKNKKDKGSEEFKNAEKEIFRGFKELLQRYVNKG